MTTANIGAGERRKRRVFGFVVFGFTLALGAALILGHAATSWRFILFLPLFLAALGYFQDRDKT